MAGRTVSPPETLPLPLSLQPLIVTLSCLCSFFSGDGFELYVLCGWRTELCNTLQCIIFQIKEETNNPIKEIKIKNLLHDLKTSFFFSF